MLDRITGSCLCARVAFEITGPIEAFHWCHCSRCRKDTGSAHASNLFIRPESLGWLRGESLVKRFDLPEAERFATAFCTQCGSPAPYLNRTGTYVIVPAGILDDEPRFDPQDNIYWKSRASWYDAGLTAPKFDEGPDH
jgi:hypothetical protein